MRRVLCFLCLILLCGIAFSRTIHVPDDKATIQAGIDSAAVGDTVLVHPNTYLENIDFNGKNIVVGSLFLTTRDTSYISQTVIDEDTCEYSSSSAMVSFGNDEDSTAVLCGFTVTTRNIGCYLCRDGLISCRGSGPRLENLIIRGNQNGSGLRCDHANPKLINSMILNNHEDTAWEVSDIVAGYGYGGGIDCYFSNVVMENVVLRNNQALVGGGISAYLSKLEMKNVTISYNYAETGGGIYYHDSELNFNFEKRCNIYWNHATSGLGNEIRIAYGDTISVVVDTFTVFNPTNTHIYPQNRCTYNILNAKAIPVTADLYVSPFGEDSNSGLIPSEPLQSIRMAVEKVVTDSLHPRTIFLGEGEYSNSNTGEAFPITMKSYLTLCGDSSGQVTVDAGGVESVFYINQVHQAKIKHATITGGYAHKGGGIYCKGSILHLENVRLRGNSAYEWLHDVFPLPEFVGKGGGIYCINSQLYFRNGTIDDNYANGSGGGMYIDDCQVDLNGVLIHENYECPVNLPGIVTCFNSQLNIQNTTIYKDGIHLYGSDSKLLIVNSIVWGHQNIVGYGYGQIAVYSDSLAVAYSDIEGGLDSLITSEQDTVHWLEGNIDTDPLFLNPDSGDFSLQEGSPCIDAGTAFFVWQGDTILNLSSADYNGDAPDMGAFESTFTSVSKFQKLSPDRYFLSQNYPNPFNPETTIEFGIPERSHITIKIYDILGREVKKLVDESRPVGHYQIQWKAENVGSGVYFYHLKAENENQKYIKMGKCIYIK